MRSSPGSGATLEGSAGMRVCTATDEEEMRQFVRVGLHDLDRWDKR